MISLPLRVFLFALLCRGVFPHSRVNAADPPPVQAPWFGIQVVDEETGRGVPLAELRLVSETRLWTDNAGWVAFQEPGLMDREVFFHLGSPGYEARKDGFGFAGVRLTPVAGKSARVTLKRVNIAERVGRLTGQGLYRDSELLGRPRPLPNGSPAGVTGQDSIQIVPYNGKLFYLWGDTNVAAYPLGNFRVTCAVTDADAHPETGLAYEYFLDPKEPGRPRQMMPLKGSSHPVWLFGLLSLKDEATGRDVMYAHFGCYRQMVHVERQGIAKFNDERGVFEVAAEIDKTEKWRFPTSQAVRVQEEEDGDRFYFTTPFLQVRVAAKPEAICDPQQYEALRFDPETKTWRWQRERPPLTQDEEAAMLKSGQMPEELARFALKDPATGEPVKIHRASVQWNPWRKRWILIGTRYGGKNEPSLLGEIYYAESASPHGPWRKAVKVASHPRYTFYNPIHHAGFNREGGRVVYFEGTYTKEFSGNPSPTPRYDYNQIMYRLDLNHPALKPAWTDEE